MSEVTVSLPNDPGLFEAVTAALPEHGVRARLLRWDLVSPPPLASIDLVVPPYWGGSRRLRVLNEVDTRLVQWQSIGFDGVGRHLPAGRVFANARGVHEASTAELTVGLAIMAQRQLPQLVLAQERREWMEHVPASLADSRVLLVGYGGVSKAVEARLQGFEVQLKRVASVARDDVNLAGVRVPVFGVQSLLALLSWADVVVVAVPLTAATDGMFGVREFAAMRDGALFINVARGRVVDTAALTGEVCAGRLRAAVDVTQPEPLPAEHPLWGAEGCIVTPHVGGSSAAMLPRIAALIARQAGHLLAGEPLENIVQP